MTVAQVYFSAQIRLEEIFHGVYKEGWWLRAFSINVLERSRTLEMSQVGGFPRPGYFKQVELARKLRRADTRFRGRFRVKRYGPSRRRTQNASVVLKKSRSSAKKDFCNTIGTFRTWLV
jgi:hypothetical protein